MWFTKPGKTKIRLLVKDYLSWAKIKKVYDTGNGPFIYDHIGNTPRYLKRDGSFENPDYRVCSGDAVSWMPHIGVVKDLNWKERKNLDEGQVQE